MEKVSAAVDFSNAKPFLKWAGGKSQLLKELEKRLPPSIIHKRTVERYVEPFLGGGAMFFFLKRHYQVGESFLFDKNRELIMAYKVIKNDYKELITDLSEMEDDHLQKSEEDRKENYYQIRETYNRQINDFDHHHYHNGWIKRAGYLIFLNKTCFNGLFRQNQKGEFNVPFGRYKNPKICDEKNLVEVHKALENAHLFCGDFTDAKDYIHDKSLVYLDPPYRPISSTSYFTSYSKEGFNDEDQENLADFFKKMDKRGAYLMLSNSDPKNQDKEDGFFDTLYKDFKIERVVAKRNINRDAKKRGKINELIIRNYFNYY
jgi:DNA adenine methylase